MGCPRAASLKMMGRYGSSPAPTPCRNTIGRSAELPALLLLLSWMMLVLQLAVVEGRDMVDRPCFMGALHPMHELCTRMQGTGQQHRQDMRQAGQM